MHIVLGLLTSIVTILYLLDRLGVDIGWLNPFAWRRRRAWAKKYEGDPIYAVEDPIHVAAILIAGVAKLKGDLDTTRKQAILEQFRRKFSLDERQSNELLTAATHLLGAPQIIESQLNGLADRHRNTFSGDQAESLLDMLRDVASADGEMTAAQRTFVDDMCTRLNATPQAEGTWA